MADFSGASFHRDSITRNILQYRRDAACVQPPKNQLEIQITPCP